MSKTKTKKTAKKTVKNTKKSTPAGSSTLKAMNDYIENLTTAGQSKPSRASGKRSKSGGEPMTYEGMIRKSSKREQQKHTREEVTERVTSLRKRIGEMYASGKFTTNSLVAILTVIDNITFYKCSGEYDHAISCCIDCQTRLDNA